MKTDTQMQILSFFPPLVVLPKAVENLDCCSSVEGPNPAWHMATEALYGKLVLVLNSSSETRHWGHPLPLLARRSGDLDPSQLCFGGYLYLPAISRSRGKRKQMNPYV